MKKKLILVTSPPACGKTYVAMKLAAELNHVVYLDKDALIILSRQIFETEVRISSRSIFVIMSMRRFSIWQ
jgi:uridine kinase